jgi:4-hydroxybenzoate polyprenyltransferase
MKVVSYIRLLRPVQWLKNLIIFFPPFLGGAMLQDGLLIKGALPFLSFCLCSSASYIMNDILDAEHDTHHKTKKKRPIASGKVSITCASILGICLVVSGILIALFISRQFLLLLVCYLLVSALYSMRLKAFPVIDIFCIALGFLFRLQAGGEAFGIVISEWLFLSVFLLALLLGTGKRLSEKTILGADAGNHRKSLLHYPDGYLDGIMHMTGGAVLVTYTMYVITRHALLYTVPLCTFGLMRYTYLVKTGEGGDPTESLVKDKVLFAVGFLWAVMVACGIYGR